MPARLSGAALLGSTAAGKVTLHAANKHCNMSGEWAGLGLGSEHFKFLAVQTANLEPRLPLDDDDGLRSELEGNMSPSRSMKQSPSASRRQLALANGEVIRSRLVSLVESSPRSPRPPSRSDSPSTLQLGGSAAAYRSGELSEQEHQRMKDVIIATHDNRDDDDQVL